MPATNTKRKVSAAKLAELRAASKQVRADVAAHRDEIEAEGDRVIADGIADGSLVKVSVLFRGEGEIVSAMDRYAAEHGLQSRAQVIRTALAKLLKTEVATPKWGWQKGRPRKT